MSRAGGGANGATIEKEQPVGVLFLIVFFFVFFLIVGLVLLQEGKGGGLTGMSTGMDGVMGAKNPLRRMTAWLFVFFVLLTVSINWYFYSRGDTSIPEVLELPKPAAIEEVSPATGPVVVPAPEPPAEPAEPPFPSRPTPTRRRPHPRPAPPNRRPSPPPLRRPPRRNPLPAAGPVRRVESVRVSELTILPPETPVRASAAGLNREGD